MDSLFRRHRRRRRPCRTCRCDRGRARRASRSLPRQARAGRRADQSRRAARLRGVVGRSEFASRLTDDATVAGVELGFGEVAASPARPVDGRDGRRRRHTGARLVIATGLQGQARPYRGGRVRGPRPLALRALRRAALCRPAGHRRRSRRLGRPEAEELRRGKRGHVSTRRRRRCPTASSARRPHRRPRRQRRPAVGRRRERRHAEDHSDQRGVRLCRPVSRCGIRAGFACTRRHRAISWSMHEGRTSMPTAFAAGDVRAGARYHLSDAIADGQRAGQSVVSALQKS